MTPVECLESAARMETLAQSLYGVLAIRYGERADLRELFNALAVEEEQHADRIRALAQHRTNEDLGDAARDRLAGTLRAMEAELVALMEVGADGRSLDEPAEILQKVIDFESRFVSVHAEYLAQDFAPGMQGLFSALARQDRNHVGLLTRALDASEG